MYGKCWLNRQILDRVENIFRQYFNRYSVTKLKEQEHSRFTGETNCNGLKFSVWRVFLKSFKFGELTALKFISSLQKHI